jgi:hypothetical protein
MSWATQLLSVGATIDGWPGRDRHQSRRERHRRNWLFADTVSGAKASAHLYSLAQTARANELEPYAYLRRLFTELPAAQSVADIETLLPFRSAG